MGFIYLGSSSPRRYELLTLMDIPFQQLFFEVVEQRRQGESPLEYVCRLASTKAQAGVVRAPQDYPVLGADTIVVLAKEVLEKPQNAKQATEMLQALSGQTHRVMTAIALADRQYQLSSYVITSVTFRSLQAYEIEKYVACNESMDKAGGYAIQGKGGCFIKSISGSYHAVIGLPLVETRTLIDQFRGLRGIREGE